MIIIEHTVISDDIAERHFVCNLEKCKGACCVEGDEGAPLEKEEAVFLKENIDRIKPYLSEVGIKEIEKQGTHVDDRDGEPCTPTINGRECAYALYDDQGVLKCGIQEAHQAGEIDFPKPISCHLYPIRVGKYDHYHTLNYDRWSICNPACELGQELAVPIYKFLKEPLIRQYGEDWYEELCEWIEEKSAAKD